jgi:hypothetical protein
MVRIPNAYGALIPNTCRPLITYSYRYHRSADLSIHHEGEQRDLISNGDDGLVARADHANYLSILRDVFVLPANAFESSVAYKLSMTTPVTHGLAPLQVKEWVRDM